MARFLLVVDDGGTGGSFRIGMRLAIGLATYHRIAFACQVSLCAATDLNALRAAGVEVIELGHGPAQFSRATHDKVMARATIDSVDPDGVYFLNCAVDSTRAMKEVAADLEIPFASMQNLVETPKAGIEDCDQDEVVVGGCVTVFVSEGNRQRYRALFPRDETPQAVITNGLPDVFFCPANLPIRIAVRSAMGLPDNAFLLLHLARIEPRKGQRLSLAAVERLRDEVGDRPVYLAFAGSGLASEVANLQREVASAGLGERVFFLGPRHDVPDLIEAADALIFPTFAESDGLASKEAMAMARPVIVSDLPEIREQGHPEEMIVPDPNLDSEATIAGLVAAINRLRLNPHEAEELGRRARAVAESKFRESAMVEAHAAVLARLPPRVRDKAVAPLDTLARLVPGQVLRLNDPVVAWSILGKGWSDVEADGIWSMGEASDLKFQTAEPVRSLMLQFEVEPLAGLLGGGRAIKVLVNGRRVANWRFLVRLPSQRRIRLLFPQPQQVFEFRFEQKNPRTPQELRMGDDDRRLGFFLRSLRVETVG
jgi:hypothetical protein